ncbi:hypothetical protein [Shewanella sp.]|uniref:hypothetical protein n=1 Tax=Shewanella sp. TaxID=50422 RepID=UPI001EB88353|nr:hypothetical protein [Shewanella sp.]NRB25423.1 hypothetical protein [Shewanella sp.]
MSIVHEDQSQSRNASLAVRGQTGRGGSECYLNLGGGGHQLWISEFADVVG